MTVHAPHRPMPMQQRKLADWTVLAYFAWGPSRGSVFTGVGAVLEEIVRLVVQLALVEQVPASDALEDADRLGDGVEAVSEDGALTGRGSLERRRVLAYHSALDLLGFAHSVYRDVYYLTSKRRKDLRLPDGRVRALLPPKSLRDRQASHYGVETLERLGVKVRVTGPERTLVDCFAVPRYAGGLEEVMESGRAIAMLDLEVLGTYLDLLGERRLFAVLGFFLEQQAHRLFVSPAFVERLERKRPVSKIYLDKHQRGGRLVRRWNLVVPERWLTGSEVGERV